MKHCSTCTCPCLETNAEQILALLTNGVPHRQLYRGGRSNRWFITYGGPEVPEQIVQELQRSGAITTVYDDPRADAFHVGKTLDLAATQEARKGRKRQDGRVDVYTDGTREIKTW